MKKKLSLAPVLGYNPESTNRVPTETQDKIKMIKRTLAAVVVLGGLCGVGAFANTFVVGVENNPSDTDPTEGYGDFNDMVVQFGAVGLTATVGGSWSNFLTAPINELGASGTNPFWDNVSADDPASPAGKPKNIGYCLTTTNCNTIGDGIPVTGVTTPTQYLTATGDLGESTNFYFTFGSSPISSIFLGAITPQSSNEWFGIYNIAKPGQVEWLIENGVVDTSNVVGGYFTPLYSSFGLVFENLASDDVFLSDSLSGSWVDGSQTTIAANRFALFQTPDSTTPEPGTMAMVGLGVLALGLIPKLRKRS